MDIRSMIILYCSLKIRTVLLYLKDKKNKLTVAIQAGVFQHMPKKHSAPGGPAKVKKPRKTRLTPAPRVIIKGQFMRFFTGIFYRDAGFQKCSSASILQKFYGARQVHFKFLSILA